MINNESFLKALVSNFLCGKSILIVDDEIEILNLIESYLIKSEINKDQILTAIDGEIAIEIIKKGQIGLILLDIKMPQKSGLDVCDFLKSSPLFRQIPVIIISGNIDTQTLQEVVQFEVKNVLVKPFNYHKIVDKMCSALSMGD